MYFQLMQGKQLRILIPYILLFISISFQCQKRASKLYSEYVYLFHKCYVCKGSKQKYFTICLYINYNSSCSFLLLAEDQRCYSGHADTMLMTSSSHHTIPYPTILFPLCVPIPESLQFQNLESGHFASSLRILLNILKANLHY